MSPERVHPDLRNAAAAPETDASATLEAVLDRYLQELSDGRQPDPEEYLRRYPEMADALRGVFRTLDFVEATTQSLNASRLERGRSLGEYRIIREIGRGGMGVVYEAVQTSLNRRVALKVLPTGALLTSNAQERFAREAAAAGRLHHTNIVPVYAIGEEQGIHFYAMQYIEGHSLGEYLKRMQAGQERPDKHYFRRIAAWGRQTAEALAHAHTSGTVHRDVKPSNLLLDKQDNVWLTDFGLAREDTLSTITISGDVLGTARYMSPEQAGGGRAIDGRTDIYSLGVTLYEMIAQTPAFDGESREVVLNRIATQEPPALSKLVPGVPRDLETILIKCMRKQPDERYVRAADLAEDFRRFLDGEPIRARRTPWFVKAGRYVRRHRLSFTLGLIGAVLVVVAAGLVMRLRLVRGEQLVEQAYRAMMFEQDSARAAELLDGAERSGIDSADLHLYRGLAPLFNAQPQRAIAPLMKALERAPDRVETLYALTAAYDEIGDTVNASRFLERVTRLEPTTELGWLLRGVALKDRDQAASSESYDRALQLRADFTPVIRTRAMQRAQRLLIEGRREDLEGMLNDFDAWVTFWPRSSASYSARATGHLYAAAYASTQPDLKEFRGQCLAGCARDLDEAQRLNPDSMNVRAKRGVYYSCIGDFARMEETFADALRVDLQAAGDEHPGLLHYHALALHALGRIEAALADVTAAEVELSSFQVLHLHKGLLLAELGRVEEGRQACRLCYEHESDDPIFHELPLLCLELLGDREGAAVLEEDFRQRLREGRIVLPEHDEFAAVAFDFVVGAADSEQLRNAAGKHHGRQCEATFLIGLRELGHGRRQAGAAAIQQCLDTGVFSYVHYRFAQVIHERIRANPDWPSWMSAE